MSIVVTGGTAVSVTNPSQVLVTSAGPVIVPGVGSSLVVAPAAPLIVASKVAAPRAPLVFTQAIPATPWVVTHNLGYRPMVQIMDDTWEELEVTVTHPSVNQFIVNPAIPLSGYALYS